MNTRHLIVVTAGLLCGVLYTATPAMAQSIEEKLRSALRSTTEQLRQLQDTQSQLQADKSNAEQQRDKALADLKQAQADLAAAKGKSGADVAAERALSSEKASHAQDVQQLAKYKSSYEELLTVSRARDAERTQAQTELKARDTQLQTCEAKNAQLYQVGQEILNAYEHVGLGSFLASRQPFAQSARVKYDEIAQRYGDQLYGGKFDPAARPAKSATAPATAPAAAAATASSAAGATN
jgi:DNA repair exonuclease SbcCD ATPase subunit